MNEIEKDYNKLSEKYKLPNFKKLDQEFELSTLKDIPEEFILRSIRRKITEKIVFYCRILEGLIHPINQSIITLTETKLFSDEEKVNITNLLKQLMFLERESLMLDINSDEENELKFINKINNLWSKLKSPMEEIAEKMRNSWKIEQESDRENYFG